MFGPLVNCFIKLRVKEGRFHVGLRGKCVCRRPSQVSCNQFAISPSSPLRSFAFPEDQVQAAADQSHGEADPGQDVGGAVGAHPEVGRVEAGLLIRVDGGCDHHAQAWWERVGRSSDLFFFFFLMSYCTSVPRDVRAQQKYGVNRDCSSCKLLTNSLTKPHASVKFLHETMTQFDSSHYLLK